MVLDHFFQLCKDVLTFECTGKNYKLFLPFNSLDNELKGTILEALSNVFDSGNVMGLSSGDSIQGLQGTQESYEKLLERSGLFDILEEMQRSPDTTIYEKAYTFINKYLTLANG